MVSVTLTQLCRRFGKPLVVFFDEADCLFGRVLIAFLRQLRDGYVNREEIPFPASIALIGMLDVRDYKAQIRPEGGTVASVLRRNTGFHNVRRTARRESVVKYSRGVRKVRGGSGAWR